MNELPEDFRDLLLELADVGAEFVLVGGHAVLQLRLIRAMEHWRGNTDLTRSVCCWTKAKSRVMLNSKIPIG